MTKCVRCGTPATHTWDVCALKNKPLHMCDECDVIINELVVRFFLGSKKEKELKAYRRLRNVRPT